MREFNTYEMLVKLIGFIEPIGSTHIDNTRFENQIEFEVLVDEIVASLAEVSSTIGHEWSIEKARTEARHFLRELFEDLRTIMDDWSDSE